MLIFYLGPLLTLKYKLLCMLVLHFLQFAVQFLTFVGIIALPLVSGKGHLFLQLFEAVVPDHLLLEVAQHAG